MDHPALVFVTDRRIAKVVAWRGRGDDELEEFLVDLHGADPTGNNNGWARAPLRAKGSEERGWHARESAEIPVSMRWHAVARVFCPLWVPLGVFAQRSGGVRVQRYPRIGVD
jgi:hypothetical protein